MVPLDKYLRVRIAHRDGMGINQLARTFHHSKRKIRQILAQEEPTPYHNASLALPSSIPSSPSSMPS